MLESKIRFGFYNHIRFSECRIDETEPEKSQRDQLECQAGAQAVARVGKT